MHDDMEHREGSCGGPKCQCIECQSLTDLENEWRCEHEKLYGANALTGIGDDK